MNWTKVRSLLNHYRKEEVSHDRPMADPDCDHLHPGAAVHPVLGDEKGYGMRLAVEIFRFPYGIWDLLDDDGKPQRRVSTRELGLRLAGVASIKQEVFWEGITLYTSCEVHGRHAFASLIDGGPDQMPREESEQAVDQAEHQAERFLQTARRQAKARLN